MSPEFLQEIKMLVLKGEMIEAKTLLFQHFGNLSEAKAFLETLLPTNSTFQAQYPEILAFINGGLSLQAVKLVRDKSGWDLKTSKDFVDKLRRELGFL